MKTILKTSFEFSLAEFISACGASKCSLDNSAYTVTFDDITLTLASTNLEAGAIAILTFDLGDKEISATLNWADDHIVKIKGSGTVRHRYDLPGTYNTTIRLPNDETFVDLTTININKKRLIDVLD